MYCGIDVSKDKSNICVVNHDKDVVSEFEICNDRQGYEKLLSEIEAGTLVGMESTGNYSKNIYYFLENHGVNVYYVDNVQMKNYAKLRYLHVKNDKVDAKLIAEYLASDFKKIKLNKMNELKDLSRLYFRATQQLAKYKKSFKSQLIIIFPELEKNCYMKRPKGIAHMLIKYSNVNEINNASAKEIYEALVSNLKQASYFTIEYAKKIKKMASESVGVKDYPTQCFKHTIKLMLAHQEIVDEILKEMKKALQKTPYTSLLDQKGYGLPSIATIVGEVGDIRRFSNHKKFVKYCGLDVSEKQSGRANSTHCFITKQGNRILRAMFYNLILPQLSSNYGFSKFYNRLKAKGKHPQTCMTAVSRKIAIKTYYDMKQCHNNTISENPQADSESTIFSQKQDKNELFQGGKIK